MRNILHINDERHQLPDNEIAIMATILAMTSRRVLLVMVAEFGLESRDPSDGSCQHLSTQTESSKLELSRPLNPQSSVKAYLSLKREWTLLAACLPSSGGIRGVPSYESTLTEISHSHSKIGRARNKATRSLRQSHQ